MACCTTVTVYSVAVLAPTIIGQFQPGHSSRHVQALAIPIFLAATVGCLAAAYASDKLKHRAGFAIFGYLLVIVGAAILINQNHVSTNVKYGALYFMAVGAYIALPMLWTMLVNNVSGSYKIGFAVALEVGIGNFGGIASALVFQGADAPLYSTGYKTILGMSIASICLVIIYTLALFAENKARDAGKRDHRLSDPNIDNLGDDHPQFRYGY
jgi:sugar phosphate permease